MQEGQLDDLDEAAVDQILADWLVPPCLLGARWTDSGGNSGKAAHAYGQHMQLGDLAHMAQVQAIAQQLLSAAAAAAADIKQPRRSRGLATLLPLVGPSTGTLFLLQRITLHGAPPCLQHTA